MKVTLFIFSFFISCIVYSKTMSLNPDFFSERDSIIISENFLKKQFISNCENDILLTEPENNFSYLYHAANSIIVQDNYRVNSSQSSNIIMKAGKAIVLKYNTVVLQGTRYLARIESCVPDCINRDKIAIQKGISPNGDSMNDSLDLSELCVNNLKIFNRYGIVVYEKKDYMDDWYGQSENSNLPTGTYFYNIVLTSGEIITGWIYLQR